MISPTINPGSAEGQIEIFTHRIRHLTEHLKINKKDFGAKKGLQELVSKRSRMLKYFYRKNVEGYVALCQKLSLRK